MVEAGFPRRIVLGEPAGEAVLGLLRVLGARRVVVVTDRFLSGTPGFRLLVESLRGSGLEVTVYSGVVPEPPEGVGREIAGLARGADAVVAYGGGSVIDAAKMGALLAKRPELRLEDVAPFNPLGVELERPVVIAVPTTAGTGSDASYGIVYTAERPGGVREKVSVGSPEVVPWATVLDPDLPLGAPPRLRAWTMVDALSHALESLASTMSTPLSEALAEQSARLIVLYGPGAARGSREDMLRVHTAATMAGMAFSASGLGLAHALAHPLGAALGTHHGATVGIVMLGVLPLYLEAPGAGERFRRLEKVLNALTGEETPLPERLARLYREIGAPTRFSELGVEPERFEEAARRASEDFLHDPNVAFSPVIPEPGEALRLLQGLY